MRFAALASGSSGNATFVSSGGTRLLIDDGLSVQTLEARLRAIGECFGDIDGILVSHAHSDHVSGLARAMKHSIRRGRAIPVYATEATAGAIDWEDLEQPFVKYFVAGKSFVIGDIEVSTCSVPHDCADPIAVICADNRSRCGIATDLGFIPPALISRFRACDLVMLESNYEPALLEACDLPAEVRSRISGRNGHLSNPDTAEYLAFELSARVRHLVLAHRSLETNTAQLVRAGAERALFGRGVNIKLAEQDVGTGAIEI